MKNVRMMTPRERAVEIAWRAVGRAFSRGLFEQLLGDDGDAGRNARELVAAIERGIEDDRMACAKATAPS
jgi:hypothetical protein